MIVQNLLFHQLMQLVETLISIAVLFCLSSSKEHKAAYMVPFVTTTLDRETDWPKVAQEASWLSRDLNLGLL